MEKHDTGRGAALRRVGITVHQRSMESKAAEMLEEEERSQEMVSQQAAAYHKKYSKPTNDLGESDNVADDDGSAAPWAVEEKKKKKVQKVRKQESAIEAAMRAYDHRKDAAPAPGAHVVAASQDDGPDLGESVSVGANSAVQDANALSEAAQAQAHASIKARIKAAAIARARKIADKVRNLVKKQQQFEHKAGAHVQGSVLGEAVAEHDKATALSHQDELLANKMEDDQAKAAFMNVIEKERKQQRKEFESEREQAHAALAGLKTKLKAEQKNMLKEMKATTAAQEKKMETSVENTQLAQTIEAAVRKKLAKRLGELKAAGAKAVTDVMPQLTSLKARVRHLRREQSRMKVSEASMQSEVAHASSSSHRDLGESSSMSSELEKMRMEQMMMQQQQQQQQAMYRPPQQMQQPQPQMMQQPQMTQQPQVSAEHTEFLAMKSQMAEMQRQNALFRNMLAKQATMTAAPQQYTQDDLAKFFQTKKAAAQFAVQNELLAEKQKLDGLVDTMSAAPTIPGAQMLVEIDEDSEGDDAKTAMPLYHQHAEQARIEMEELRRRAMEDAASLEQLED